MSAIFGMLHLDGAPASDEVLARMAAALAHCGPDRTAWHAAGPVGMGQRMLHTTPESFHEVVPLADDAVGLVITADARLDYRVELQAALGLHTEEAPSDTQLILAAYARWGTDCLSRLDGDFTFAIWDNHRRRLFCARDRFGIRPFYYTRHGHAVIFASEIKGLLAAGAPGTPNDAFIGGYLLSLFDDPQATARRDINRLPAAHTLTVSEDGVTVSRYWSLRAGAELRLRDEGAYAEAFRDAFTAAVRERLRAAVPVGTLLSGGMDSSSVTCLARNLLADAGLPGTLHTFSGTFDDYPACDERPYIEAVHAGGPVQGHLVAVDQLAPFGVYVEGQVLQDEPYLGTTHYLHWGIYGEAQDRVRILLEGHGGDSVISHGLTYLTELLLRGRWGAMLREARAYASRDGWRVRDVLWEWGGNPLIPRGLRRGWRAWREAEWIDVRLRRAAITPAFAAAQHLPERLRAQRRDDYPARSIREEQESELSSHVYTLIFDWFSTAALSHGIDVRYPFFDRRLVEFCLSLPAGQRLSDGWTRAVLRRAMQGILPEKVQWRGGKANLAPCFFGNLTRRDRDRLGEALYDGETVLQPYLDMPRMHQMYRLWADEAPGAHRYWEAIWFAATLSVWLRQLTRQAVAPL